MTRILLTLPLLALAACDAAPPKAAPPATPTPPACTADSYKGLIGQPKSVLDKMTLPPGTRVIGHNQPVTMDYRIDRLNFEVGSNGKIEKVACY